MSTSNIGDIVRALPEPTRTEAKEYLHKAYLAQARQQLRQGVFALGFAGLLAYVAFDGTGLPTQPPASARAVCGIGAVAYAYSGMKTLNERKETLNQHTTI